VNDQILLTGDALLIEKEPGLVVEKGVGAEVLVFDLSA
jgi:hypothetical protein